MTSPKRIYERLRAARRRLVSVVIGAVLVGVGCGVGFAVAGSGGEYVPAFGVTVPPEKQAAAGHALPNDSLPETTAPAPLPPAGPFHGIPAAVEQGNARVEALSPALIRVSNSWIVSNGRRLVVVYAGAAGDEATRGRVVIIRQDREAGSQTQDVVDVPGSGALTINGAPLGPRVETSAQTGVLQLRGTAGFAGSLNLVTERVTSH